jgi:hypothetical protein
MYENTVNISFGNQKIGIYSGDRSLKLKGANGEGN